MYHQVERTLFGTRQISQVRRLGRRSQRGKTYVSGRAWEGARYAGVRAYVLTRPTDFPF